MGILLNLLKMLFWVETGFAIICIDCQFLDILEANQLTPLGLMGQK